jgi:hypothetical protein
VLKPLVLLPAVGRKGGTCRFIGAIPRGNPITTLSPLALSDDQLAQIFRCAGALESADLCVFLEAVAAN